MSLFARILHQLLHGKPPAPPGPSSPGQPSKPPVPATGLPEHPPFTPGPTPAPINLTDLVSNSNNLIPVNNARFTQGSVTPGCFALTFNQEMFDVSAKNDAADMIRHSLGHYVEPTGGTWGQCAAAGVYSAQQAVDQWMRSPPHRAIMLDPKYKYGGLAIDLRTGYATLTVRVESRDVRGFVRP